MRRYRVFVASVALLLESSFVIGQTTAGTSATIVVPVIAQSASFASEVTLYNPNAASINVNGVFYDAQNTASPGPKACTSLAVGSNVSKAFTVATQCALPSGSNFGLLVLSESTGTNRFYGYARTQTPQGIGFSTEGFPIENFNDQIQHATGLKRVAAAGGLPAYQTNCFVASLGDAVSYELRLFDGSTNVQLGSTLSGALAAFQQFRYLDVFAAAGVAAGNKMNVRAQFTNLTGNQKKLIGFCTVQENTTFSADFRIAKSYGGTPQNAFVQGGNAFGTAAVFGTIDDQPLTVLVNDRSVLRILPAVDVLYGYNPNVIAGKDDNVVKPGVAGATIGGGGGCNGSCPVSMNAVTGVFGTIAGGSANTAGEWGAIGGGDRNTTDGGLYSTIGGGIGNGSTFSYTTVGGGLNNQAVGNAATVPGGSANSAIGNYSVALGHDAVGGHDMTLVWNGWSTTGTQSGSFRPNYAQFMADHGLAVDYGVRRDDGGGSLWVCICDAISGQAIGTSTGAFLSTGGVWTNNSDRARKTEIQAVDPQAILDRVIHLPVATWRYIAEDEAIRHIGPMAQDFHAAFGIGTSETSIATVDADGVALAAIQGLHQMMREKDVQIEAQQHAITEQQHRIAELETRVGQVEALRAELDAMKRAFAKRADADVLVAR